MWSDNFIHAGWKFVQATRGALKRNLSELLGLLSRKSRVRGMTLGVGVCGGMDALHRGSHARRGFVPFTGTRFARSACLPRFAGVLPWIRRSRLDIDKWLSRGVSRTQRRFYICRDTHLSVTSRGGMNAPRRAKGVHFASPLLSSISSDHSSLHWLLYRSRYRTRFAPTNR